MSISASELLRIQQDLAATCLDKTCTIQRNTPTSDTYGHKSESYAPVHTGVPCGLAQPSATLLANYDYRIATQDTWKVNFAYGTDVLRDDHLLIEGHTLEVHVVLEPHTVPGLTSCLAAELH